MRKLPSTIRAGSSVAMAEFDIRLSPPVTAAPPPSSCDARRCPWWPYTNAKDFKANTALILVVLFCALICTLAFNAGIRYLIRLHFGRRRREEEDQKAEEQGGGGGGEEEEEAAVIYEEGMELGGAETECVICLSEFAVGEKIRVLEKCKHGFHVECVRRWLDARSSCPTCRTNCDFDSVVTSNNSECV